MENYGTEKLNNIPKPLKTMKEIISEKTCTLEGKETKILTIDSYKPYLCKN